LGLIRPTARSARINGLDIVWNGLEARHHIGLVVALAMFEREEF